MNMEKQGKKWTKSAETALLGIVFMWVITWFGLFLAHYPFIAIIVFFTGLVGIYVFVWFWERDWRLNQ